MSDLVAAKVRSRFRSKQCLRMTGLTTVAATPSITCRECKRMLRQQDSQTKTAAKSANCESGHLQISHSRRMAGKRAATAAWRCGGQRRLWAVSDLRRGGRVSPSEASRSTCYFGSNWIFAVKKLGLWIIEYIVREREFKFYMGFG